MENWLKKQEWLSSTALLKTIWLNYWRNYIISSGQGGKVYTEAPCRAGKQSRLPNVAYIIPKLLEELGEFTILPQSIPLIAEIASPDDSAEELLARTREYLQSGCQEVWLLFPESQLVLINAQQHWLVFNPGELVSTQTVLQGCSGAVDEFLTWGDTKAHRTLPRPPSQSLPPPPVTINQ